MTATGSMEIIALGGLGEIGMNLMVYGFDDKLLVVDCGLAFPGNDTPGIDVIIPDVGYLIANRDRVVGFVLTHGHEDHVGAMPYVWPDVEGPIYGSAMTLGLLRGKFREHRLLDRATMVECGNRQPFQVGPFNLCMIQVSHSIVDSYALAIKTPLGTIIHTGDFKIDHTPVDKRPTDLFALARYGEGGVLALLSDSTNINRPGATVSEKVVAEALAKVFAKARAMIIVATFASNIQRIQQIFDAACAINRKVVISGRSMQTNIEVARSLGFLRIPEGTIIDVRSLSQHPRQTIVVLSSGSQGEQNSSLTRIANGEHREITIQPDDMVILSSRFIPGNEQTIWSLVNRMSRLGAEVIHEHNLPSIHVSGHAPREDLKLMLALTRPKFFIPIHGEIRHLHSHRQLAMQMGVAPENALVAENGDRIVLHQDAIVIDGRIPSGRTFVDGKGIGDISDIVLRDRRHLSEDGMVIVVLIVEKSSGKMLQRPELLTRGVVTEEDNRDLLEQAKAAVEEALLLGPKGMDFADDEGAGPTELAQRAIRRLFKRKLGRRPAVIPLVMEM
ncbi:MAG: ribonuclease J [Magnetococcales bacterium]|nr:ribonuclease J [Magnetococcales bacterium]